MEKLYHSLPRFMQNKLLSIKGHQVNRNRYNELFDFALDELIKVGDFSLLEKENYKDQKFNNLLSSVSDNNLYLKRFEFLYGSIDKFGTLSDLNDLKPITKHEVKMALQKYPIVKSKDTIICHTSGTTGSGLVFPVSKLSDAFQWAVWWRYRKSHGINLNDVCGYFGGRAIVPARENRVFYRYNKASQQVMFSAYHLNSHTIRSYVEGILRNNVKWLHGYPSFLSYFASLCLEFSIDLSKQIEVITIGAESLLPQQKSILQSVFKAPVVQHYGLSESVANISESTENKLIVDDDFSHVFFKENESGGYKIIGSNLHNSAMPLLNYDTGDIVNSISENSMFRYVDEIDGRKEDFVVLSDGTKVGRLDHIFKDIQDVIEVQIVQDYVGHIKVNLVPSALFSPRVERKIIDEFYSRFQNKLKVEIVCLDKVERTRSGKLRFVISKVK
ncbi:hypothetical protein KW430_15220 [Vibrio fluvialis]|nr:hypothetical protein [Vibrio fluvialis]